MTPDAGYSGTPLPRKLGIKAGHRVLLLGAPESLVLAPLPDGVRVSRRVGAGPYDVVVAFCRDSRALERRFETARTRFVPDGAVWLAWPKRTSGVTTDLGDEAVRAHGLAAGLVDVKVCAIDETWSALRFVRRLADRP